MCRAITDALRDRLLSSFCTAKLMLIFEMTKFWATIILVCGQIVLVHLVGERCQIYRH